MFPFFVGYVQNKLFGGVWSGRDDESLTICRFDSSHSHISVK